jgi:pyrimidine-nucleoside phosphorylase
VNVVGLIARKRDGETLAQTEIEFLINGYAEDRIPDYQMSALAMAILLRGMSAQETAHLTRAMLATGTTLEWTDVNEPIVDKHSTGGVGDKISIILSPLLACCGLRVPMISGRGLGPTGGTLDKLESIAGFRTDLSLDEIQHVIRDVGCVITGASAEIAPADKRLYALRDVTATVESIPLITASILSKKLSEGLDALVLDVKFGTGAFMQNYDQAKLLARSLVDVADSMGVKTTALLTDMNQPLGIACGNANEILESIDVLSGSGPADVRALTLRLAGELLISCKVCSEMTAAIRLAAAKIDSGEALKKFRAMVRAQGGDLDRICKPVTGHVLVANRQGYIARIDTRKLGMAIIELGGGRKQLADEVDFSVGLDMLVRVGDPITSDQQLLQVYCEQGIDQALEAMLRSAIEIGDAPVSPLKLIHETIQN